MQLKRDALKASEDASGSDKASARRSNRTIKKILKSDIRYMQTDKTSTRSHPPRTHAKAVNAAERVEDGDPARSSGDQERMSLLD